MLTNGAAWPSFCYYTGTLARHLLFCPFPYVAYGSIDTAFWAVFYQHCTFCGTFPHIQYPGKEGSYGFCGQKLTWTCSSALLQASPWAPYMKCLPCIWELYSTVFFNCHHFPFLRPKILLGKVPLSLYCRTFKSDVAQDVYCVFRCFEGKRNWHYCSIVAYLSKHCIAVHWSGASSQL